LKKDYIFLKFLKKGRRFIAGKYHSSFYFAAGNLVLWVWLETIGYAIKN